MSVVEIDGGNQIEPTPPVDSIGILYPGERMDVIVSGNQITDLIISLDQESKPLSPFRPLLMLS